MTQQIDEPVLFQKRLDVVEALAMRSANDPFAQELLHRDTLAIGVPMTRAHGEQERLREQRPSGAFPPGHLAEEFSRPVRGRPGVEAHR
jgi:hypothetical protein